jgi:hypothetical protein
MSRRHITHLIAIAAAAAIMTTAGCGSDPRAAARPAATTSVAAKAQTAAPKPGGVSVGAHWENPPDKFTMTPPCSATAYVPKTGLCRGTGSGRATISGSWHGFTAYEYGFATTPANLTYVTVIETFTGTIPNCGTGSMTYRLAGTVDAAGKIEDEWTIVPGFGSGGLANVTGHGTQLGRYKADFTQSGDFSGHLACGH